jgi:hypothetical protein
VTQTKKGKLVRQDADGIWIAATLAAKKSGLSKPELAERAMAGALRFQENYYGRPSWYAETEIAALAAEFLISQRAKNEKPKRQKSDKQIAREIDRVPYGLGHISTGASVDMQIRLTVPRDERFPKGTR